MKKEKTMASPELTREILQDTDLVQEYVEYLRLRVKKNDDGAYCCETSDDDYKCWDKTEQFCKEKGLDFDTVLEKFNLYFGCESNIATEFGNRPSKLKEKKQWKKI